MNLIKIGWNKIFQEEFNRIKKKEYIPARIIREEKGLYYVYCEYGECLAEISGKLRYNAKTKSDFPSVGDWVAIRLINDGKHAIIYNVLSRKSSLTRKAPISGGRKIRNINGFEMVVGGATEEQVIASNIDTLFLVIALDKNYNLRRLERYLTVGWNSGAEPVVVLNKMDLCDDFEEKLLEVKNIAMGVNVHCISALKNKGIEELRKYIGKGKTIGLFGSSGVGKSTIINCILGTNKLITAAVRDADNKGRHTTTWRELVLIPSGGVIIDTPGMRELQVWLDQDELDVRFNDIKELESKCKFNDCSHDKEPGCAIKKALEDGTLDKERYKNYLKMKAEVDYLDDRKNERDRALTKKEILMRKIRPNK